MTAAKELKALRKPANSPGAMPESRLEIRRPRRVSSPPSPRRELRPAGSDFARVNEVNEADPGGRTPASRPVECDHELPPFRASEPAPAVRPQVQLHPAGGACILPVPEPGGTV